MQTVDRLITFFIPKHYKLDLTLNRAERTFRGAVEIVGALASESDTIRLHAKDLTITSASINNKKVSFTIDKDKTEVVLKADKALIASEHTVTISFEGKITESLHGLHPCYFEHDGKKKEILVTQLESHHAREVFACVDEPEAKATFDLTLTTETGITVLSNMPVSKQSTKADQLVTSFETTPRMSTYLLAFVAGELHKKSVKTKDGVEVNVWATPAQAPELLDFALDTAKQVIEFFNDYFGVPYPLPKSDQVALPDFAAGAMENWGLITYREVALLVDPKATAVSSKEYIATVIAHELSHQWFGNLVTMKWWDDLWLNESFATLMEYVAVDAVHPDWDIWMLFATHESLSALRRDALPGVQAVKTEVKHPDEISTLFDPAIVYAKGAKLLAMLRQYVGDDAFRKGLQVYFKKHQYKNTVGADLWQAISEASKKDIAGFMTPWLTQPGYPVIAVHANEKQVTVTQERFVFADDPTGDVPNHTKWPVPLLASEPLETELLEQKRVTVPFTPKLKQPLRLNKGGYGHYITHYTSPEHVVEIHDAILTGNVIPVERLNLLNEAAMLARAGYESIIAAFQLLEAYNSEQNEPVWDMISYLIADAKRIVEGNEVAETKLKTFVRHLINTQYERLGWEEKQGEPATETKLRATVLGLGVYSEDPEIIYEAQQRFEQAASPPELPPEIRGIIYTAVVRHGPPEAFTRLLKLYKTTQFAELQQDVMGGLTGTRDPECIDELLNLLTDQSVIRLQDADRWFIYLIRNRYAREAAWQWMVSHWDWIVEKYGSDKSYEHFPRYAASALGTYDWLDRYKEFFEPKQKEVALGRTIKVGIIDIASRAAWRERDKKLLVGYLSTATALPISEPESSL